MVIHCFYPFQSRLTLSHGVLPWDPEYEKNRSPWAIGSENRTILRSLVLTHYQRVTEYRTYPPGHIPHGHFPTRTILPPLIHGVRHFRPTATTVHQST